MSKRILVDHNQHSITAAVVWELASASANAIDPPRGLLCTVDGTITIEDENGTEIAGLAVTAGTVYPLGPTKITAITDATVYLLY